MKDIIRVAILCILAAFSFTICRAQFVITPGGYRDAADTTKNYVVITVPGSTAESNFAKAKEYITTTFVSPRDVLSETTNMLSVLGHATVSVKPNSGFMDFIYSAIVTCKDDRLKVEFRYVTATGGTAQVPLPLTGGTMLTGSLVNKKGVTNYPHLCDDLNKEANDFYNGLSKYLTETPKDDW